MPNKPILFWPHRLSSINYDFPGYTSDDFTIILTGGRGARSENNKFKGLPKGLYALDPHYSMNPEQCAIVTHMECKIVWGTQCLDIVRSLELRSLKK